MYRKKNIFLPIVVSGICLISVLSTNALAADKAKPKDDKKNTQPVTESATPVTNQITQGAAKAGIKSCLKRVDQVSGFLAKNSSAGAFLFPATNDPNNQLFSVSMEVDSPATLAYASASFAPVGTGGCGGVYDAITYWQASCQEIATKQFSGLKSAGIVKRSIQVLDGGPKMRVFLMPAGQGCIAIKKEVVF